LNYPNNIDDFFLQFGGIADFRAEVNAGNAPCAGMDGNNSLVSQFNRVICRIPANQGYCWTSFDFGNVAGEKNIFAFPDQFVLNADGGESFCRLSTGQQAYFVFNAAGARRDEAPNNVVSDYNPDSGGIVKTGLHCMRCHELNVIERLDQVRDQVLANQNNFEDETVDFVEDVFPENADWTAIYADDISRAQTSVDAIDVPIGEEVVWAMSEDYEAPLTAARVAAQLGIPEGELSGRLASNDAIEVNYQTLDVPGGTITRDLFETIALDTICDLQLGQECPDVQDFCGAVVNGLFIGNPVPCPLGSICNANGECTKVIE
jgi:hypothetical protein